MDDARARALLERERHQVTQLLEDATRDVESYKDVAKEQGDFADPAEPLEAEGEQAAVAESLRARLAAIERAEARLQAGTYGISVRSGAAIPDERLEADPAAELTVEEAARGDGATLG